MADEQPIYAEMLKALAESEKRASYMEILNTLPYLLQSETRFIHDVMKELNPGICGPPPNIDGPVKIDYDKRLLDALEAVKRRRR